MRTVIAAGPATGRWLRRAGRLAIVGLACAAACVGGAGEPRPAEQPAPAEAWVDLVEALGADPVPPDTTSVTFGTTDAAPLLGQGWSRALERNQGATLSWAVGLRSGLRLYAGRPEDRVLIADVRPFPNPDGPPQRVELRLNGESLGVRVLAPDRQQIRWDAPRDVWRAGVNELEAVYAHARAPDDPPATGGDRRELSMAWYELRVEGPASRPAMVVSGGPAPGVFLPFDRPVDFYIEAGRVLELRWSDLETQGPLATVTLRARACGDVDGCAPPADAITRPGAQRLVIPGGPGPRRVTLQAACLVDPPPDGGIVLRGPLLGPATGAGVATGGGVATGAGPTTATTGPAIRPAEPSARPTDARKARTPANIIVYLVDTLRADRLGMYGYGRPTSPRLDALARQSIVFDRAYANAPWTLPAVASIFTGLYPWTHGVDGAGKALAPQVMTLAGVLSAAGYDNAAFLTNGLVGPRSGLASGFALYQRIPENPRSETVQARAETMHAGALAWLDQRRGNAPFFLYLHASDPHAPYRPPAAQRARFAPAVPPGEIGSTRAIERLVNAPRADDGRYAAPMSDLYDGEVAYTDEAFGEFLAQLDRRGLLKDTLLVFLADHGEALFEHRLWGHEWWLYEEVVRIPLLIRLPGAGRSGRRSSDVVQQVDLMPTILDVVGLPIPAGLQGRSLAAILRGRSLPPCRAYAGVAEGRVSWLEIDGTRRTIVHQHNAVADVGGDGVDLFDLSIDPQERMDETARAPVTAGLRRARLLTEVWRTRRQPAVSAPETDLELLRSLGYIR